MQPDGRPLDPEDRPGGSAGVGRVEDLVLGVVDRLVEVLDRRQVLGDEQVEQVVEEVIGAVRQPVRRVALDLAAVLVDRTSAARCGRSPGSCGPRKMSSSWSRSWSVSGSKSIGVEDEVEVIAPVVDLGDVGLLERVLDRQRVEVEDVAEQRLDLAVRGRLAVLDIDPERPVRVVDRLGDPLDGPVQMDLARLRRKTRMARPRAWKWGRPGLTRPGRDRVPPW